MPKGPINTPYDDYITTPISGGKKVDKGNYDEYAGITSGDSDTGGELGTILTSYDIGGVSNDPPEAGKMPTTYDGE